MTIRQDLIKRIINPLSRWRTLHALGLSEKRVFMCDTCGLEWPTSEAGMKAAIQHAKKRAKEKGHYA